MEITEVKPVLEALLFVSDKPLTLPQLGKVLEGVERKVIHQLLEELKAEYDENGRGFRLSEVAEGWQLTTRPQHSPLIRKLNRAKVPNRLSRPSLETLAIIAYKQPITKAEVENIRGVNSDGVMYSLLERRLVRTVGRKDVAGRPLLYGTTREFLQTFGLKDLSELPRLAELKDLLKQDSASELWDIDENGKLIEKKSQDFIKSPSAQGGESDASAPADDTGKKEEAGS